jgi:hypothetical protein
MELEITRLFQEIAPMDYSASAAELGQSAGRITWGHAVEDAPDFMPLDDDEKRDAFRAFVRSSGGWSAEEIAAWSDVELNALCLQWIAGDMREGDISADSTPEDWAEYERRASEGQCAGRIFRADDGKVYFYCGD